MLISNSLKKFFKNAQQQKIFKKNKFDEFE